MHEEYPGAFWPCDEPAVARGELSSARPLPGQASMSIWAWGCTCVGQSPSDPPGVKAEGGKG